MSAAREVFISYAHQDDLSLFEDEAGWVSTFHRALEVYLGQLLGKSNKPEIWRDPQLGGNEVLENALLERLSKVAALVCVVSPSYVDSDWCVWELQRFWQAIYGQAEIGDLGKTRIFKVVMIPVPRDKYPPEFQPLIGYEFYKNDPTTGKFELLDPSIDPAMKRDYWAKLNDLAQGLRELFESLGDEGEGPDIEAEPAASATPLPAVFLAETSSDLTRQREDIRRDLLRHGYSVLPDGNLPVVAAELETMVREQLSACRLSVHLVGRDYGVVPDGTAESSVAIQSRLAAERAGEGLERLIWKPKGLDSDDPRQRQFLDSLWAEEDRRIDVLDISLEELKTFVHQKLQQPEQPAAEPAEVAGGPRQVYLICDEQDLDQTAAIEDYLYDHQLEVVLPLFDAEDEEQMRVEHEASLAAISDLFGVVVDGVDELGR